MIRLPKSPESDDRNVVISVCGVLLFAVSIVNCAWVCDDAYITFRTIDNWVNGYGLRWNIAERVQTFTHPLWLFVLTPFYAISGNIYYASVFASILLSVSAVGLAVYVFGDAWAKTLWICLALTLSKAFVDFSTSGLENPLQHLLLLSYLIVFLKAQPSRDRSLILFLLAGLLALNRLDSVLLVSPSLATEAWRTRHHRLWPPIVIGFLPLVLWLVFATVYYGSPFPNTAYAKLNTGGSRLLLIGMGLEYFTHSFQIDPITLLIVVAGLATGVFDRHRRSLALRMGICLHAAYLIWIGGDFMSGRFLTPLFLTSVVLVCQAIGSRRALLFPAIALTIVLSILTPASPLWARWYDHPAPGIPSGVVDERAHYFGKTGLFKVIANGGEPVDEAASRGKRLKQTPPFVSVQNSIGTIGFYAGPGVHIIDRQALADPFLARLPAAMGLRWRQGHYTRSLPRGYIRTVWKQENRLVSPVLSELYDVVALVTREPLWSFRRLEAIVKMGLGGYAHLAKPVPEFKTFDVADAVRRAAEQSTVVKQAVLNDTSMVNLLMVLTEYYIETEALGKAASSWTTAQHQGLQGERVWQTGAILARALQEIDQGRLATRILGICAPELSDDRRVQMRYAEALFTQGYFEDAARAARLGFSFDDPRVPPLRVIADVMRINRIPEAEVNYRAILRLDPGNAHARAELLAIQSEKGNPN